MANGFIFSVLSVETIMTEDLNLVSENFCIQCEKVLPLTKDISLIVEEIDSEDDGLMAQEFIS